MNLRGLAATAAAVVAAAAPAASVPGGVADTPCASDPRAWRVGADGLCCTVAHDAGVPFALRLVLGGDASRGSSGRISFTSRRRKPQNILDSWIPPYVGIRATEISFRIRVVRAGGCSLSVLAEYLPPGSVPLRVESFSEGLDGLSGMSWKTVRRPLWPRHGERLADLSLEIAGGKGASCEILVSDVALVLDDGTTYEVLSPSPPLLTTGMPARTADSPLPHPMRPRIQFGVAPEWPARYRADLPAFGEFMAKYLPEYDIVLSMNCGLDPNLADVMRDAPPNVFFQEQDGLQAVVWPRIAGALVRDRFGRPRDRLGGVVTGTHPFERMALEDRIAMAASIGYRSFQMFDYVWHWPGAPWGFDDATGDAFRSYLLGGDAGLRLAATDTRPERTVRFREYYEDYFGAGSMPEPSAFGLDSWEKFTPRFSTDAEKRLHWTLCTYQWLVNAQDLNDWAAARCGGPGCDYLLNGEGLLNANDHVYLTRLRNTGIVSPEFFHGAVSRMAITYRNDRLVREARRCGKTAGVCVETSSGGGASQPYWSEKTGYALCYLLSALGFDSIEYDHFPEIVWKDPPELHDWASHTNRLNVGKWRNLTLAMSDTRGYRQAKLDGARKPAPSVFLLRDRTVNRSADDAAARLADRLIDAGIDFSFTDPQELPDILDAAGTIIVAPSATRPDVRATLERWRCAAPGRRVFDADSAIRDLSGNFPLVQRPVGASGAWAMPFDCASGRSAVLVNAGAARSFGSEKAYEAWLAEFRRRKLGKKESYDHALLMFPDVCDGAEAFASVPARDGRYRVYSTFDGTECLVEARGGILRLDLGDKLCDVVYYGPDDASFSAFLDAVRAERDVSAEFLFQDDSLVKEPR